jgi:hypothetical protein
MHYSLVEVGECSSFTCFLSHADSVIQLVRSASLSFLLSLTYIQLVLTLRLLRERYSLAFDHPWSLHVPLYIPPVYPSSHPTPSDSHRTPLLTVTQMYIQPTPRTLLSSSFLQVPGLPARTLTATSPICCPRSLFPFF